MASSASATRVGALRARHVVEPGEQFDVLPPGQRRLDGKLLRAHGRCCTGCPWCARRASRPKMRTSPCCTGVQGGEHPDDGGLARAVRAEQADASRRRRTWRSRPDTAVNLRGGGGEAPAVDGRWLGLLVLQRSRVSSAMTANPFVRSSIWVSSRASSAPASAVRRARREAVRDLWAASVRRSRPAGGRCCRRCGSADPRPASRGHQGGGGVRA